MCLWTPPVGLTLSSSGPHCPSQFPFLAPSPPTSPAQNLVRVRSSLLLFVLPAACDPAHPRSFFLAPGPSSLALPTSWAGRPSPSARIPGLLSSTPDLSKGLQWTRSPRPAAPVHQGDGHLPPANHDVPRGGTCVSPAHLLLCISENPSAYTEAPHQAKPGAPDPVARSGSICDALHSSFNHSAPPRPLREHLPSRRPR